MIIRKKSILLILAISVIAIVGYFFYTSLNNSEDNFVTIDSSEINQTIENNSNVILYVRKDGCIPCKNLQPYINELAKQNKYTVISIHYDTDSNINSFFDDYNIKGTPTLLFFKNEIESERILGFVDKETLNKTLSEVYDEK